MAVSANALTLTQQAVISNDVRVQKITFSLLQNGSVLTDIPFLTRKTMTAKGVRWEGNLPTISWKPFNSEPDVTSGTPTPYEEQGYLVRNAIDVDHFFVEDENVIQDPRGVQIEGFLAALAYDFNDKFINNDHVTGDSDAPVGLRARLDNYATYGVASELKIDAGAVDMRPANMTAATASQFFGKLTELLQYLGRPDGMGVVLYMNDLMVRQIEQAVRTMGAGAGFSMTQDAFGRMVPRYRNAEIRDIGRKADQSTRIITYTETSAGAAGASDYTSIYAAVYGEDRMIGWQFNDLIEAVQDIGRHGNAGTLLRTLIDWFVGLYPQHTRCMGRLYGIRVK